MAKKQRNTGERLTGFQTYTIVIWLIGVFATVLTYEQMSIFSLAFLGGAMGLTAMMMEHQEKVLKREAKMMVRFEDVENEYEKRKNDGLTNALRNLSDDELFRLKEGIASGRIDEAQLQDTLGQYSDNR